VWLVGLAAVMSAISLYYYLSVLKQVFVRDGICADSEPLSFSHRLAVFLPACALVVLGVFPGLLLDPILLAVAETLGSR
jgi:NADH-quinone oxidoreductase subunit N